MHYELRLGFQDDSGASLTGRAAAQHLQAIGPTMPVRVGLGTTDELMRLHFYEDCYRDVEALVDTGASMSCIDQKLAEELQMPCVGEHPVSGVGGTERFPEYPVAIRSSDLRVSFLGKLCGVKLTEGMQRHQVILGRDFLMLLRMVYDGLNGVVVLQRPRRDASVSSGS